MGQGLSSMLKLNGNNGLPPNCSRNNIFKVRNFDEAGIERTSGRLIIFPDELVLHQKATDSAPAETFRWPLRSLRRYGYDSQTFSFESGRRCLTGPGVYAFKCKKAIALFNTLQMHIQNATSNEAHHSNSADNNLFSSLQPRYTIASEINTSAVSSPAETAQHSAQNSRLHLYVNSNLLPPINGPGVVTDAPPSEAVISSNRHVDYVNTAVTVVTRFDSMDRLNQSTTDNPSKRIHYVELDLQSPAKPDSFEEVYFNVTQNGEIGSPSSADMTDSRMNGGGGHNYMNLGLGMSPMQSPKPIPGSEVIASTESYTMIDFAKTKALASRTSYEDAGIRKTRHNSSIDDLISHRE